jgi:hypothetical protein
MIPVIYVTPDDDILIANKQIVTPAFFNTNQQLKFLCVPLLLRANTILLFYYIVQYTHSYNSNSMGLLQINPADQASQSRQWKIIILFAILYIYFMYLLLYTETSILK